MRGRKKEDDEMSKLEVLLHDLCPDGVEYKAIKEIAKDIYRGSGIKRTDVTDLGIPCVRYGEIYTTYGIWFEKCVSHTIEENIPNPKYFEYGDILFAITGESVEEIAKSCAYIGHEKCLAGGDIVVLKHDQDPKYLSYALSTSEAQVQKSKGKIKSKVVHSSVPAIQEIVIPIPPLEVQHEIVRILDNFTECTAEFTATLTAELTARNKQYEYYSRTLFPSVKESDFDWVELGKIATVTKLAGFEFTKYVTYSDKGKIIALRGLNVKNGQLDLDDVKYIDNSELVMLNRSKLHIDDMLFTYVGTVGQVALIDKEEKYYLAPNVALIRINNAEFLPKYMMYYFLSSTFKNEQILKQLQSSSMKNIPMEKIRKFKLPKVSIEEQKEVINILDYFHMLYNDITQSLSDEIETRQKQYEYYRDKLLTFRGAT